MKKKKRMIGMVSILAAVCLVVVALVIGFGSGGLTFTSGKNNGSSAGNKPGDTLNTPDLLDKSLTYYADINIQNFGTITVKLDQSAAPITCANFVKLAQSGFYDGLTFHRIMEGYMMQGGDPQGNGFGGSDETIVGEFTANGYDNPLSHTRGAISMARANDYNSASSQFFIMQEDVSAMWDGKYAVFGYVMEGIEVVDAVCAAAEPTDGNGTIPAEKQPVMTAVTIRTEPAA